MKAVMVDSLVALVFFTTAATLTEWLVAGLTWQQILATRLGMVPVILLSGRPYGLWRNLVVRRLPIRSGLIADVVAFLSFQVPLYGAMLLLAGAMLGQAVLALGSATLAMLVLARPYGLLLDWVRQLVGVYPCPTPRHPI